jgi:UBX domain-containing protein 1
MSSNRGSWWSRSSNQGPRIGRVGQWDGAGQSRYAVDLALNRARSDYPHRLSSGGGGGRRIATLRDIGGGGAGGPPGGGGGPGFGGGGHGDDDDDDDDEHEHPPEGQDMYAGGERSGLSIQNPNNGAPNVPGGNIIQNLLRRAAEAGPPPSEAAAATSNAPRWGSGNTLGGEDMESMAVPDPDAPAHGDEGQEPAIRRLTFWRDGFTVDDGDLMRYDDPQNARVLAEIETGRAPPAILNVLPGQPVELRVARKLNEDFVPPPSERKPFDGSGNRLGGAVPDIAGTAAAAASSSSSMPGALDDSTPPGRVAGGNSHFEVNTDRPVTSLQIRLADGTRLVSRMNLTHTVGDIRAFVNA